MVMTPPTLGIDELLERIAETIDIPMDDLAEAERQYGLVGEWLSDQGLRAEWTIYPQGSMRLGTVVRPLTGRLGFDLDMVCRVCIAKESTTQTQLRDRVGAALQEYTTAAKGEPGAPYDCQPTRRCWTLYYPGDRFHMDVLPSIPDLDDEPTGILLTDQQLRDWQRSNPIAYADWFRNQMALQFLTKRAALASEMRKSIEEVPEWQVRTTLQRVVQILKLHRDVYFQDDHDDRPPSILITTLAAHAYDGSENLFDAVLAAVRGMPGFIEQDERGRWVVCSPVSEENFADKWNDYPQRQVKFREWLSKVTIDLEQAADTRRLDRVLARLGQSFGQEPMTKTAQRIGIDSRTLREAGLLGVAGPAATITTAATATRIPKHGFYGEPDRS